MTASASSQTFRAPSAALVNRLAADNGARPRATSSRLVAVRGGASSEWAALRYYDGLGAAFEGPHGI
ncbi:hypothetical protein EYF80_047536 [Liparis tanakae]|uniref:Uncharacterized protein n=1 Tax=Liparis tanakae TaxID=230148 RepID=A0A4Z2FMD9_9TELE|nr:hypothetical protein EYF80_047536 [Liparis tanakae]